MNRHGETFEERPLPGEYKCCPLRGCKYKLYVGPPDITMNVRAIQWAPGATVEEAVQETVRRALERQEALIRAHLKTHKMVDFYTTMAGYHQEYREKVAMIEKLKDLVFYATATQEQPEEGN